MDLQKTNDYFTTLQLLKIGKIVTIVIDVHILLFEMSCVSLAILRTIIVEILPILCIRFKRFGVILTPSIPLITAATHILGGSFSPTSSNIMVLTHLAELEVLVIPLIFLCAVSI